MSYLRSNGLVDGSIPANQPCPFHQGCNLKNERCPTEDNLKPHAFSCALARLNSLIKEGESQGASCGLLKKVRDNLGKR